MIAKIRTSAQWVLPTIVGMVLLALFALVRDAAAINQIPTPSPIPGSYGLQAVKTQPPPSQAPTISTPGNGASFNEPLVTVTGICQGDLLVQVYNNGVMVGSAICKGGSYSIQISLFAGTNELTAIMYDSTDQASPVSNTVTVTFNDSRLTAFGALITLTSSYGRRAAPVSTPLSWPLQLTGGTGPYAFSIDWGDGSAPELKSQAIAGLVTINHTYKKAGIYQVNIKVTDVNGVSAFLQVVAVANGKVDSSTAAVGAPNSSGPAAPSKPEILWIPTIVLLLLLLPTYWLGRRSQLVSIRNRMLRDQEKYNQEQAAKQ